ncbi:MAG TPA: aspartyl/asparaginyl beta-hydroxylase domain-containing protein [Sphingomicrobium sp.]|nr:aspartyl/asparaginyl beta-hydroxylase domain-containing protein [Sphingomicrobium sp.]
MSDASALEQQADQAAAAGRFAAARSLLEQAVETDGGSIERWMKLSAMRKAAGDLDGALAAVDRALALSPLDFSALLSRALILERLGSPNAGEEFGNALAQMPSDEEVPEPMKPAVAHARQRRDDYRAALEAKLLAELPEDLEPGVRARAERFVSNRARRTCHYHQEPTDFHYPGLPEIEFHDPAQFAGLKALEDATDAIRAEFEALMAAEAAEMVPYIQYPDRVPMRQWKELNHNPDWTAIHLLQNGRRIEANARHCPNTIAAIARLDQPQVPGASPNAMFSLLAPRTRIPPHTGVANTRLVCHLPLIVPPACGFRCGATTREWRVGEAFVFDDTIEHEAWNDGGELRVVLIVDLWPPALGAGDRAAVAAAIGASGATFMGKA